MYTVYCTLYSVLYTVHCTVYSKEHSILHTMCMCSVHCSLHTVHCTLHGAICNYIKLISADVLRAVIVGFLYLLRTTIVISSVLSALHYSNTTQFCYSWCLELSPSPSLSISIQISSSLFHTPLTSNIFSYLLPFMVFLFSIFCFLLLCTFNSFVVYCCLSV